MVKVTLRTQDSEDGRSNDQQVFDVELLPRTGEFVCVEGAFFKVQWIEHHWPPGVDDSIIIYAVSAPAPAQSHRW